LETTEVHDFSQPVHPKAGMLRVRVAENLTKSDW